LGFRNWDSCRNLFKILNILPLTRQYVSCLLIFVVNKNYFTVNADNYNVLTRQRNNLYIPQSNLAIFQKGSYYLGIKTFTSLPTEIKDPLDNPK
jgi:hypothetical protein